MSDTIFAFDFDGVVCDSVWERLYTGYNAFFDQLPSPRGFGDRPFTFDDFRGRCEQYPDDAAAYHYYASMLGVGGEAYAAFLLIGRGVYRATREELKREIAKDPHAHGSRNKHFYDCRTELRARHTKEWHALNRPHPGAVDAIRRLAEDEVVYLATAKDESSARELLTVYAIVDCFREIVSPTLSADKTVQLSHIVERERIDPARVAFVDDLLHYAQQARRAGVTVYLADWGLSTPEQLDEARAEGIPVLSQNELLPAFRDFASRWRASDAGDTKA